MLNIRPVDCTKELLHTVVGPPVTTSCRVRPITFSCFQLFVTVKIQANFLIPCLIQLDFSLQSTRPLSHCQDKILKCTALPTLKLSTTLPILLKSLLPPKY